MHYLYILLSLKDNKFYIGATNNLKRRFKENNNGEVLSTKGRRPLKLIYYSAFLNEKDAVASEKYFKTTRGKQRIRKMLENYLKSLQ
jgi:putative endonuclease